MKPSITTPTAILKHSSLPVSLTFCPQIWHIKGMLISILTERGEVTPERSAGKKIPHQAWNQHNSLLSGSQPLGAHMYSFPSALLSLLRVKIVSSSLQSRYFKSCYKNRPQNPALTESYAFCLIPSTTTTSITSSCYFFAFSFLFSPVLFARKQWHCSHF